MYPKTAIDRTRIPEGQKTFKGAKHVSEEWLTKKSPVRDASDADFKGKRGGMPIMRVSQPEGRNDRAPHIGSQYEPSAPKKKAPKYAIVENTPPPASNERLVRGEHP